MLDKNTSQWLDNRERLIEVGYDYFCPYCINFQTFEEPCRGKAVCMLRIYPDYEDEARYEAQVARYAAEGSKYTFADLCGDNMDRLISIITHLTPAEMALMAARIQADEEMRNE